MCAVCVSDRSSQCTDSLKRFACYFEENARFLHNFGRCFGKHSGSLERKFGHLGTKAQQLDQVL